MNRSVSAELADRIRHNLCKIYQAAYDKKHPGLKIPDLIAQAQQWADKIVDANANDLAKYTYIAQLEGDSGYKIGELAPEEHMKYIQSEDFKENNRSFLKTMKPVWRRVESNTKLRIMPPPQKK